jgi:hypothetical protein
MGNDGFFRGHQVSRVLGVAVPLAMFLVWWGVWGLGGDVISVTEVTAEVVSDDGKTCLVKVESGEQVRILKPRNATIGTRLQLRRTEYDDGELRFDPILRARPEGSREAQIEGG